MARRTRSRAAARQGLARTRIHSANSESAASRLGRSQYRRRLWLEALEDRRLLAGITVTTLADTVDFNDGVTSLREAIFAANTVPGPDTIEFAPALTANGPATIWLYQGELRISDPLKVEGPGTTFTILAGWNNRIFNIDDADDSRDIRVAISDLTLSGANTGALSGGAISNREDLSISASVIEDCTTYSKGGAIYSVGGRVTMRQSLVVNNTAGIGGGIFVMDGELTIEDSIVSGNTAGNGGGVAVYATKSAISDSKVELNSADDGGGVFHRDGTLTLLNSLVAHNKANTAGGLRVYGGGASISNSVISDNRAEYGSGGGIRGFEASITISECIVSGNRTQYGGSGGGIWAYRGTTTVINSRFEENIAAGNGGGIGGSQSAISIYESIISGNSGSLGGGIYSSGTAKISKSQVLNNSAGGGGGVFAFNVELVDCRISRNEATFPSAAFGGGGGVWGYGRVTLERCEVSDNSTAFSGGGVHVFDEALVISQSTISGNRASQEGGGVFSPFAKLELEDSTISGNVAGTNGGGLKLSGGWQLGLIVNHSTIVHNSAAAGGGIHFIARELNLNQSIVASNIAAEGPDILRLNFGVIEARNSLIGDNSRSELVESPLGLPDSEGNLIGGPMYGLIDPLLGPLADNGGFELPDGSRILTHALLAGSPAINAGDLNAVAGEGGVPEFDQRGEPFGRIVGGRIDIGAFEYQTPTDLNLLVDTLVDESDGDYSRGDLSLREAIELANAAKFAGVVDTSRFDPALWAAGPATILLTRGELKITDSLTIDGPGAELLTIDASGNDPTPGINNSDGTRVLAIDDARSDYASRVTIQGLTLTGGDSRLDGGAIMSRESLTVANCRIVDNSTRFDSRGIGGGVYVARLLGSTAIIELRVIGTTLESNIAIRGGAIGLVNANAFISDSLIESNIAGIVGGGVYVDLGELSMASTDVRNNTSSGRGGGVFASWTSANFEQTTISNNSALGEGGGILSHGGEMALQSSTVSGNSAGRSGGGIALEEGLGTVTDSMIHGNWTGIDGGGIHGNVVIENSEINDNYAKQNGGGVSAWSLSVRSSELIGNIAENDGGGIFQSGGTFQLESSTLALNQAGGLGGGASFENTATGNIVSSTFSENVAQSGGGISIGSPTIAIRHSTLTYNFASFAGGGVIFATDSSSIDHSIIAFNGSGIGTDIARFFGSELNIRSSLVGQSTNSGLPEAPIGSPDENGNLVGGPDHGPINPMLGPLADNGGPTKTHALLPGSPAIDVGDPSAVAGMNGVPVHDQRGAPFTRVFGGRIDMGAVEAIPVGVLPGDYNDNGVVDTADYSVWRDALGPMSDLRGDGNGDGKVDALDYEVWQSNFGAVEEELAAGSEEYRRIVATAQVNQSESLLAAPAFAFEDGWEAQERARVWFGESYPKRKFPDSPAVHGRAARKIAEDWAARQDELLEAWWAAERSERGRGPALGTVAAGATSAQEAIDFALAEIGRIRCEIPG